MPFYTDILKSKSHNSFYYGSTSDIGKRLKLLNADRIKSTKVKWLGELHHIEEFSIRSETFRREHFFKSIESYNFLKENRII